MGVYIKGMELPTEQYGKMVITLYPNGHVAEYVGDIGRVWEAVPVPPHGRLFDADVLMREMHNVILEDGEDRRIFYSVIERQPTIIPAEEE